MYGPQIFWGQILKFTKYLSPPSFFKQSSSNFQEMFFILKGKKNVTYEF